MEKEKEKDSGEVKAMVLPAPVHDALKDLPQVLTQAQVTFLNQKTPKKEIKHRQGKGGMTFAYVEHGYVTELLNQVFAFNWDFEIVDKQILEDEVMVEARLTVRTPAGQTIVKTQFGGADIKRFASGPKSGKPLSIADDYKAAASDALKKCATLLGIGLDLYGTDRTDGEGSREAAPTVERQPRVKDVTPTPPQQRASEPPKPKGISQSLSREIVDKALQAGVGVRGVVTRYGVVSVPALTPEQAEDALRWLASELAQEETSAAPPSSQQRDLDRLSHLQLIQDHAKRIKLRDADELEMIIGAIAGAGISELSTAALGEAARTFVQLKTRDGALAWVQAERQPTASVNANTDTSTRT